MIDFIGYLLSSRGLQNQCAGDELAGGFDSHALPPLPFPGLASPPPRIKSAEPPPLACRASREEIINGSKGILGLKTIGPEGVFLTVSLRNCAWMVLSLGQHGLRCWRFVSQGAVRPDGVVVPPPVFYEHPGFNERGEDLAIEQFIPQLPVERFDVAVLPGAAGLYEEGPHAEPAQPEPYRLCRELGPVVRPYVPGDPPADEQVKERIEDIPGAEPAGRGDVEAFPGIFVNDRKDPHLPSVRRSFFHEVVGPHVVLMQGAQSYTAAVVEPEPALLGCFFGTFSPSCLQILSTLLWFTFHPSFCSIAVILR